MFDSLEKQVSPPALFCLPAFSKPKPSDKFVHAEPGEGAPVIKPERNTQVNPMARHVPPRSFPTR